MRHSHSGNGIHRSLLDSIDAGSGNSRAGGLPCECEARQECLRKTHGRFRLSVVAVPAVGGLAACLLPSGAGHLRCPIPAEASGEPRRYGDMPRPAHTESAGSDEPPTSPRNQRYHRNDRTADYRRNSGRESRRTGTGHPPGSSHSSQSRDYRKSVVGDYRRERLFTLRQSVALYREYQRQIATCEQEMQVLMKTFEAKADPSTTLSAAKDSVKKCKVMPSARAMALREEAYRILGVGSDDDSKELAFCMYSAYSPSWAATSQNSAAQEHSVRGWDCARITISAAERCPGVGRERSRTVLPSRSEWLPSHFNKVNPLWGCVLSPHALQTRSTKAITAAAHKLARIICSPPENLMMKASSPRRNKNTSSAFKTGSGSKLAAGRADRGPCGYRRFLPRVSPVREWRPRSVHRKLQTASSGLPPARCAQGQ